MRRVYSKEFKQDAISLVIEQGYGCTEAARSLGIHQAEDVPVYEDKEITFDELQACITKTLYFFQGCHNMGCVAKIGAQGIEVT